MKMPVDEAAELLRQLEEVEIAEEAVLRAYCESLRACQRAIANAVMANHAPECDTTDCPYRRTWSEKEPYGETFAERHLFECTCADGLECHYYQGIA